MPLGKGKRESKRMADYEKIHIIQSLTKEEAGFQCLEKLIRGGRIIYNEELIILLLLIVFVEWKTIQTTPWASFKASQSRFTY